MFDVAIIGGGPAGATAALFTAKAGKSTLLIDDNKTITRKALLLNYYGVPSITGPEIVDAGKQQARDFGAQLVDGHVTDIQSQGDGLRLVMDSGTIYEASQVILATGLFTDLAEKIGLETAPATEPRIKTRAVVDAQGRTNISGIWAAGTVAGVSVHVVITAGDGARVAINVITALNGERYVDHDILK